MMEQTLAAARQADLIFLLFDARVGGNVASSDLHESIRWLRKAAVTSSIKKVVLLANKLEGANWDYEDSPILELLEEAARLGFGDPIPISALHGDGMAEIAALILEQQQQRRPQIESYEQEHQYESERDDETMEILVDDEPPVHPVGSLESDRSRSNDIFDNHRLAQNGNSSKPLQLAIIGRQNVGKSTLVNALVRQERVLVGPTPGLTRDAIAVEWMWKGRHPIQVVDTAGIRKRSQRLGNNAEGGGIEDQAVEDAMRAMKVADVAVLVIDAGTLLLQRQELAIADAVLREGRALVVAANKMDLVLEEDYNKKDFEAAVRNQLEARFPSLRKTPIVPMSSLAGEGVDDLLPVVWRARERWARVVPTSLLNRWLAEVVREKAPPTMEGKGRPSRIKYVIQTKARPPTFLLFCNTERLPDHYVRYLTRHFQDAFEMYGMEVRFAVKKSSSNNPYEPYEKRGGPGIGGRQARKQRLVRMLKASGKLQPKRNRRKRS